MTTPLKTLRKILELEQEKGYHDRAVIGGLEQFLARWEQEAREAIRDEQALRQVRIIVELLRGYGDKDVASREATVREALKQLHSMEMLERAAQEKAEPTPIAPDAESEAVQRRAPAQPQRTHPSLGLDAPVERLRGVSAAYRRRLARLGVHTIGDLLYLFPRRYDDFSALKTINRLEYGEEVTIVGTVWEAKNRQTRSGVNITTAIVSDATGTIQATWFNQPYLVRQLRPGRKIVLSGKVEEYLGRLTFRAPEWEPLERDLVHTARLVPVYPLTQGLSARWMRRLVKRVVDGWADQVEEYLPDHVLQREHLMGISEALRQIHFPDSWEQLKEARRRLCFDEFLLIQLGVLRQRRSWKQEKGHPLEIDPHLVEGIVQRLPFRLTRAQERVVNEILADMRRPRPMSRLLQGDVGSGKTVVAVIAMLVTVANDAQAALMAPTEILAEQHYRSINALLDRTADGRPSGKLRASPPTAEDEAAAGGQRSAVASEASPAVIPRPRVRLLTGSLSKKEKEQIYQEIASGEADIIVGTHALIQEGVEFRNLAFVVIDEQHRFGVAQRAALRRKGEGQSEDGAVPRTPHVLVMSATPIPRTLALTVYGDLDLSIIDEMPPGRQAIKTRKVLPRERERAYQFVRSQIEKGRQAFIICPLIEASEKLEARAATEEYERLSKTIFPDLRLGLLHGRMSADEKEAVMRQFRNGELDILVATSVVEVGIDVPNATVMLIEGADRFGLAQLHQFRGRVGRGEHQSYCLLLSDSPSQSAQARLDIVANTLDGFRLAEEDLKMRGPGEFFGTRQSGLPDLKVAKLSDVAVLEIARAEAMEIFRRDPDLTAPEHARLAQRVDAFWQGKGDLS